jgi:hypothetical protein
MPRLSLRRLSLRHRLRLRLRLLRRLRRLLPFVGRLPHLLMRRFRIGYQGTKILAAGRNSATRPLLFCHNVFCQ